MAYLTLDRTKLKHNYDSLDRLFREKRVSWAVVSKLLCGNETYLKEVIRLAPKQLCEARIGNLKVIKTVCPEIETIYIRPVPPRMVAAVIKYADISFNTQFRTLKLLSDEAVRQSKIHRVIIAIEMGERREGVMLAHLAEFYEKAHRLPNIRICGLGANFACLSGVLPSRAKLERLVACEEMIAARYGERIDWISGGSSVAISLLLDSEVPKKINHFRVGETLFFGTDVYHSEPIPGLHQDVFVLYAEIIELIHKPLTPDGELGPNLEGLTQEVDPRDLDKSTWRAIVDVGLVDVEFKRLTPVDPSQACIGASSDMLVLNLGENTVGYRAGDYIAFRTDYMGVLRLMNSQYIEKRIV